MRTYNLKTHCLRGHERTPENVTKNRGCLICVRARASRWAKEHPKRMKAIKLRCSYGLSWEKFSEILKGQNNACAICKKPFSGIRLPHVDHIHNEARRVRALLCRSCNNLLGFAYDSVEILQTAIEYLKKFSEENYGARAG
jgi:hypothetical protein